MSRRVGLIAFIGMCFAAPNSAAQAQDAGISIIATNPDEVEGAAEIADFRAVIEQSQFVPTPESLSLEGLLAEYSLALPAPADCGASLCIATAAMPASLTTRPGDDVFAGLSFSHSNAARALPDTPQALVLVIDRSGSMKGRKLGDVQAALTRVLGRMRDDDRLGIVSFGATPSLDMEMIELGSAREEISAVIANLDAGGETDMEAGLRLGFDLARKGSARRVVLLTDDLPNIFGSRPDSFVAMAQAAAAEGIALSLVGVEHSYDNTLALQLSSLEGGRFYELTPHFDAVGKFEQAWPFLLGSGPDKASVVLTPGEGRKISTLFGVPEKLVSRHADGSVELALGPAFVAQRGSGVYFSLASDGPPDASTDKLFDVRMQVTEDGETSVQTASATVGQTSDGLAGAQQLVEEFLMLQASLKAWHEQGDPEQAAELAAFLNARMARSDLAFLAREQAMVASLAARMAMTLGNPPAPELLGRWTVESERGLSGTTKGDLVEFTADREFIIYPRSGSETGLPTRQTFQQGDGKLLIDNTDLVFAYELKSKGRRLDLKAVVGDERLKLRKAD